MKKTEDRPCGQYVKYVLGCRCEECREAWRIYNQLRREEKEASLIYDQVRREEEKEATFIPEPPPRARRTKPAHGTPHAYNLGCRCEDCRGARCEYLVDRKIKFENSADAKRARWEKIQQLCEWFKKDPASAIQDKEFIKHVKAGDIKLGRFTRRRRLLLSRGRERRSRRV